ncbi:COX15/CtaA family protein [Filimonas effusa]|uniref:Heme A synthase n=1 Tax=Filimonas effusa TaxID=2508721 RepID=A0A4Q1D9F6_9BACT|nr:COX15/CtaA family protein [Filimonas effusa]RXK86017.1 heme A synthase [Filimonas effusa]
MNTISLQQRGGRAVANWILIGVGMLLIQVILGGITRLTGSGLSITEWNVVTGTIPPLNEQQWLEEFNKYRQTPQYNLLNTEFNLDNFKFIFFWEWFHRFWARMIGVVFVVGFVYLLAKRYLKKEMIGPLVTLFLFGALQGAVGWIMVASGLTGDAVYVKPTRLALHFIFALLLISYAYWFALQLRIPSNQKVNQPALRRWTIWITLLLLIQLIFGALMAGHKAALAASTWPAINGSWLPDGLLSHQPALLNFIDNKITIHFIHRNLAYLILVLIILYTIKAYKVSFAGNTFRKARVYPILLVTVQVLLGILSLLTAPSIVPNKWGMFEWMAQLHQVVGMLLLLSMTAMLYLLPSRFAKA